MKITNLPEVFKVLYTETREDFHKGNTMWNNTIRLLIMLSSSFLLITLGLADKLFPSSFVGQINISIFLASAWIGYFCSTVFGIYTEINEIIFHQNCARKKDDLCMSILQKINQGINEYVIDEEMLNRSNNSIIFGFWCINIFVISTALLCISFLEKFISVNACWIIIGVVIALIGCTNCYFLKKRKI